jgi:hypothetical protein
VVGRNERDAERRLLVFIVHNGDPHCAVILPACLAGVRAAGKVSVALPKQRY